MGAFRKQLCNGPDHKETDEWATIVTDEDVDESM
jgi:hypothetical protein